MSISIAGASGPHLTGKIQEDTHARRPCISSSIQMFFQYALVHYLFSNSTSPDRLIPSLRLHISFSYPTCAAPQQMRCHIHQKSDILTTPKRMSTRMRFERLMVISYDSEVVLDSKYAHNLWCLHGETTLKQVFDMPKTNALAIRPPGQGRTSVFVFETKILQV